MNKKALYNLLWICLVIEGISSCAAEFPSPDRNPPGEEAKTVLRLPITRGSLGEESAFNSYRMIVFKQNGEFVLNTDHPDNPSPYQVPTFVETVPAGHLNVYLIANELPEWNLASITTEAQLKSVLYREYSTYPSPNYYPTHLPEADATHYVPMFGMYKGLYIDVDGNTSPDLTSSTPEVPSSYPITVQRIFSKVTLKLTCLFSEQNNGGATLALDSIMLKRIPSYSRLVPERNDGSTFTFNDAIHPFYPLPASPPAGWPVSSYQDEGSGYTGGFRDSVSFYIPEYLPKDTSLYTYLSIKVKLKYQPTIVREYKLVLGEGLIHGAKYMMGDSILPNGQQRTIVDLSILRNTHYTINAIIRNFEESGDQGMEVHLNVEKWIGDDMTDIDVDEYYLNISQSAFAVPVPYTGAVMVATDHSQGWSATVTAGSVTLNGGVTSLSNQPSGPLRFTATGAGTISVTVGKITKKIKITAI